MSAGDYRLVKAHLDLTDLHTQMVSGFIAVLFLCLVNYLSIVNCCRPVFYSLQEKAGIAYINIGLQIIDFTLYFVSCLLIGLICLEITGRFGNRLGACCAVWSSLLFSVFPLQIFFSMPSFRASRITSLFILAAIWLGLRRSYKKGILLNYKTLFIVFLSTSIAIAAYLSISDYFLWLLKLPSDGTWMIGISSVSVILISIGCLPAINNYRKDLIRISSVWGLIALILISVVFEKLFTSYEDDIGQRANYFSLNKKSCLE